MFVCAHMYSWCLQNGSIENEHNYNYICMRWYSGLGDVKEDKSIDEEVRYHFQQAELQMNVKMLAMKVNEPLAVERLKENPMLKIFHLEVPIVSMH